MHLSGYFLQNWGNLPGTRGRFLMFFQAGMQIAYIIKILNTMQYSNILTSYGVCVHTSMVCYNADVSNLKFQSLSLNQLVSLKRENANNYYRKLLLLC